MNARARRWREVEQCEQREDGVVGGGSDEDEEKKWRGWGTWPGV